MSKEEYAYMCYLLAKVKYILAENIYESDYNEEIEEIKKQIYKIDEISRICVLHGEIHE